MEELKSMGEGKTAELFRQMVLNALQRHVEKFLLADPGAKVLLDLLNEYGVKMNTAEYLAKEIYDKHTFQQMRAR